MSAAACHHQVDERGHDQTRLAALRTGDATAARDAFEQVLHEAESGATVETFAQRLRAGTRETRFVGAAVSNYLRKPYGPGWALVGDAGYNKDFITAQGIHDAFRDAELCVTALHETFSGGRSFDAAMADYRTVRDRQVLPMYEFTTELATLEPPPPELQALLAAMPGNQDAMDGFARVNAGVTSPSEFFSPQNVERIMSQAGAVTAVH